MCLNRRSPTCVLALAIVAFTPRTTFAQSPPTHEIACLVGANSEPNSDWPRRAAAVVCDVLRRHGEPVAARIETAPEPPDSAAYVTSVRRLGTGWLLEITYEDPVGTRRSERRTALQAISDVESAGAILAAAPYGYVAPAERRPVLPPPRNALILDGWVGGSSAPYVNGNHDGSVTTGFTGLFRHEWLEAGFAFSAGEEFWGGAGYVTGSVLAGAAFNPAPWFQLDLLGELGAVGISGLGSGWFDNVEEGGRATLPYFGGRAGLSFLLGRSHRFVLGWWFAPAFTEHTIVHATVQTCFLGCNTSSDAFDVGGFTFASGLRIGGIVGLGG
jgi:hypothetical protein